MAQLLAARRLRPISKPLPSPLVTAARAAIDQDLATNFDPKRQVEYDHQSYCQALQRAPVLLALLTEGGIAAKLD